MSQPQSPASIRPDGVQLRARRSPKLVALGVLTVVLGALGFAALYSSGHDERGVVAVASPVARGEVVDESHLTVVQVPARLADGALSADEVDALVGQTALTDLPQGSFPRAGAVGEDPLPDGESLVGLRLQHGQLPATSLPAGTRLELVGISAEAGDVSVPAVVAMSPARLDDGSFALDVRVGDAQAGTVARLAAQGDLAVVAREY